MVLLQHRGRKSGREYVTPMMYLPHPADYNIIYVFATKAGAPINPDWYHNLTTAGEGSVERRRPFKRRNWALIKQRRSRHASATATWSTVNFG